MRKAAFIDRDGTLVHEVNYLSRVEDMRLFAETKEAVGMLRQNGFSIYVLTNQSGIGRKLYTAEDMDAVHQAIQTELNGAIDDFFHCPHLPDAGCRCRKPSLGMIEDACSRYDIDLAGSWMIGDKALDIETGFNAQISTAMVLTGYGSEHIRSLRRRPAIVGNTLLDVVRGIVSFEPVGAAGG